MTAAIHNIGELRDALRADAAGIGEALLGLPNKAASTRRELRWGAKGSLSLSITGAKRGVWFSHEEGRGGDLLGLIRHVQGCTEDDALRWAADKTGVQINIPTSEDDGQAKQRRAQQEADRRARQAERDARDAAEANAEQAQQVRRAQSIATETVPLSDSLGEYYLKQCRGIPPRPGGWPGSIRFHPHHWALVAVATTPSAMVQAVQRVHLAEDGGKVSEEEAEQRHLPAIKTTNGVLKGAAVRLPGDPAGPLLVAEGPETALSLWASTDFEVWAALGSIANLVLPVGRQIVVCRDDDKRHSPADKKLRRTVAEWRQAGVVVTVATPWRVRRCNGSDFADVILADGVEAVRKRINAVLAPSRALVERVPVEKARRLVAKASGRFFERVDQLSVERMKQADETTEGSGVPASGSKPGSFTWGIRLSVGVGKSSQARADAVSALVAMRARGDTSNLVLAVPTHMLGDEQAADFQAMLKGPAAGLRVAVWRGRDAPNPAYPDYRNPFIERKDKTPMCGDLDRVWDAQTVGLSAQTAVCKRRIKKPDGTNETVTCPLFSCCSYQKQNEMQADIWIMSHDLLFHEKPAAMGEVAFVIVDEAAWKKGYVGAEGKHLILSVDALREDSGCPRLNDLRRQLLDALQLCGIGPVPGATLKYAALIADGAAEAIKLEYARKVDPLHPGQTRQERKDAMEKAAGNLTISRMVMAWNAVREMLTPGGPEVSGWLELAVEPTENGPVRVMRLKGRKKISDGFKVPTMLLDALLEPDLVRPFWPDFEMVADVQAEMPHQHIRQVIDRAYSLAMLEPLEPLSAEAAKADPQKAARHAQEMARRANRLRDLRALIVREARRYAPGQVLVVVQQSVEKAMHDLGPLPNNVVTAHHNAIAGRDEWRHVRALIVVGRTMPPPNGAERIAEALTGRATAAPMPWYERADTVREMADGSTMPAEADRHSDPMAEMVRWQICEGELVQIIGRPRGVNRTAADPVDVLVLTDVPLPMPLAGTLDAAELEPTVIDYMLAAGGVVFENPADAAAAYHSTLWPNREAAKKALQRGKLGTFPYRKLYIGECPQLRRIDYKVAGQGKQAAVAGFDPALCPDPEAFLTEKLGLLVRCEVEEAPSPEPDPPAASANASAPSPAGDAPWLRPEVPAHAAPGGVTVIEACPFCSERHHHHGFGPRWAHCENLRGRIYVLQDARLALAGVVRGATAGPPGYGAYGVVAGVTGATGASGPGP